MARAFKVGGVRIGGRAPLALIAGPCVIESREGCLELARRLADLAAREDMPFIFKASYDKANRSSHLSFRGPGLVEGLDILEEVRDHLGVPVLTDVHAVEEVDPVSRVVDVLQIPAFLCRQTDLVLAVGAAGKPVNVKKAQFMAPWDMKNVVAKLESAGNRRLMLTERGTSFGYNNLVVDMTSLPVMAEYGYPVVFDATHSVQKPGGAGTASSGDSSRVPCLARAAVAAGCDAIFIETHANPRAALSDKDNALPLSALRGLWRELRRIDEAVG